MGFFDKLFGATPKPAPLPTTSSTPAEQARCLYDEGFRLIDRGQKREGLQLFTEAIKVDPRCVDAHIALASAFYMMDPVKFAEHILHSTNAVLTIDPAHAKARNVASVTHFSLGQHAWDAENWAQAAASFQAAYNFAPEAEHTAEALVHCAEQAEQADALLGVVSAFEQRLAASPADARARCLAGRSYVKLALSANPTMSREDSLKRAESHLKELLKTSPQHPDGNFWLGGAYLMSNRDAEAQEIIDLLRSVDPEKSAELEELRGGA